MKYRIIGDIHGRNNRRKMVEGFDGRVIFLGDYFDSFNISIGDQLDNFFEIVKWSEDNNAILLYGNHDQSYDTRVSATCSGYSKLLSTQLLDTITNMVLEERMILAYSVGDILITHAGVTKTYLNNIEIEEKGNVTGKINNILINRPEFLQYYSGDTSGYGNHRAQGPLRVRPDALLSDKIDGYRQVVGHTAGLPYKEKEGVYFNDVLGQNYVLDIYDDLLLEYKEIF